MSRGSNTPKCTCVAYPYPHRPGGGNCKTINMEAKRAEGTEPGFPRVKACRDHQNGCQAQGGMCKMRCIQLELESER